MRLLVIGTALALSAATVSACATPTEAVPTEAVPTETAPGQAGPAKVATPGPSATSDTAAAATPGASATPGTAAAGVASGYAWPDGAGHLRILPRSATRVDRQGHLLYTLRPLPAAEELRLDYTGASYGRVAVACDLKEAEGEVAVDSAGLGRTRCQTGDLTDALARGPLPVRIEHRNGKATRIDEFVVADRPGPRTARGTIKPAGDGAVLFATGEKTLKLGYTYATGFLRTTARCGDGWLAGRPANADEDGLGTKDCTSADLAEALRTVGHPVLVKVDYTPGPDSLQQVWEVFGDA